MPDARDLMHRPWVLFPLILLVPAPLAARQSAADGAGADTTVVAGAAGNAADTTGAAGAVPDPEDPLPGGEAGAATDTTGAPAFSRPSMRLGLKPLEPVFEIDFGRPPGLDLPWLRPPTASRVGEWERATRSRLEQRRILALREGGAARGALPGDTIAYLPPEPERRSGAQDLLPGGVADFADIGMIVTGRGELGGSWTRYTPCEPGLMFSCDPGLIPQLRPDIQFGVRVGGTISERVHVNVDYDQRREFDAANNINVYYRGLEDEILQRLEVGDVTFSLPRSRYLTEQIPAGNFGFRAEGELGPIQFQSVWAQQRGDVSMREFRLGGAAGPGGLVQDASVVLDDAAFVKGQFFFLVDPDSIAGSPHIDILTLRAADAPASMRPVQGVAIQVFRDEQPSALNLETQGQLGYFLARGELTLDGDTVSRTGQYRRLNPGEDYLVHPSGLWLVLRSPLRNNEALAIAYETQTGHVVGTLNPEDYEGEDSPALRLIRAPEAVHQPGYPTWKYEMHHVYRLDSSDNVELASVELDISLGELTAGRTFKDHFGEQITYLKLFGLDEEAPVDQLDRSRIYQPGRSFAGGIDAGPRVRGTFVVFPTLRPFAVPPPVPSANLPEEEAADLLGAERNFTIYDDPSPINRESGTKFRLTARYRVRMEGMVNSFNLGGLGIREGSEIITVDGRALERGRDYTVDYDIGQVILMDPQEVFGANPDAEIRATFEQKAMFQLAPTSVFGLNTQYRMGQRGELNFMGLYQAERSLMTRPQLGMEPASIFMGGTSGRLDFEAPWLDRALQGIPGLRTSGTSAVNVAGELAMSLPNPNTMGDTYLDDFEATDELSLAMERHFWRLGSQPEFTTGATNAFPPVLDVASAARLVWQHDFIGSDGRIGGSLLPREVDQQINTAGAPRHEQVLYMTFGDSVPATQRKWRSLTTVLSTTGRDMTRTEFLEFYVAEEAGHDLALVFDIGTVAEDAFYFDSEGRTSGTYPDGRPWGLGVLDEEARLSRGEVWSHNLDTLGLWNQECRALPGVQQTYPLGDPRANCTRGNGRPDTEDLNGNGILDPEGAYFRYVVPLGENSPFLVRDRDGTGSGFRLYRVPLRGGDAVAVNGASEGTWRYIQHLRMTVTGQPSRPVLLAMTRLRIVGSRWTKRDEHGVLDGPVGDDRGRYGSTRFQVGPVGRLTEGSAYSSPPGIIDQLLDPSSQFGAMGVEYNEKGLKLAYETLEGGDRVEVYYRYPQQPRNLMSYREIRLWALARAGNWGSGGDQRFMVKVGTDARNYYLYQTPLRPPPGADWVRPEDWLPEQVIDFDQWFLLKAEAVNLLYENPDEPVVVWSADSSYAVVMDDRFRAPDLAAVREISFAVYNDGFAPADGEVWINDMRLRGAVTDPGFAGHMTMDVRAGNFGGATISYANQSGMFRQRTHGASYLNTGEFSVSGSAQLGQFAPTAWGLELPLSVSYSRSGQDPIFLDGSDVRADHLAGFRETGSQAARVTLNVRKRTPASNPWLGLLVDGSSLRVGYNTRSTSTATSRSQSGGVDGSYSYTRRLVRREFPIVPGFVEDALRRVLPISMQLTEVFERVVTSRLRWSPDNITFGTSYYSQEQRSYRYEQIVAQPSDTLVRPNLSPRQGLESNARVALRPFDNLTADFSVTSSRDLLPSQKAPSRSLREREAVDAARNALAGLDMGWETRRNMNTSINFRPPVTAWLRPTFTYSARFSTDRHARFYELVPLGLEDTTAVLQRNFQADRQFGRTLQIEPRGVARAIFGPRPQDGSPLARRVASVAEAMGLVDLTWSNAIASQFERELSDPGLAYQFGLGGIDRFRFVGADTAVAVADREQFAARSALRLPGSTQLDFSYRVSDAEVYDISGGRRLQTDRAWPDVNLTWSQVPLPAMLREHVTRLTASGGFTRNDRHADLGGGAETSGFDHTARMQMSIGFGRGLNANYNTSTRSGTSRDFTGHADNSTVSHGLQLSGMFRAPETMQDQFPNPISMAARFNFQRQEQCRVRPQTGDESCVPFIDNRTRNINLTLDTMVDELNVGFQLSYTSRQSYVGMQNGNTSFQIGLFGTFNFAAGNTPGFRGR